MLTVENVHYNFFQLGCMFDNFCNEMWGENVSVKPNL